MGPRGPACEANHSHWSRAEVKNKWVIPPVLLYAFMTWCLIHHRDSELCVYVIRLATGWTVWESNPGGDLSWGPPSLLYNGYRVFPGGRAARGVALITHPYPAPRPLLPSVPSWPVLGFSGELDFLWASWWLATPHCGRWMLHCTLRAALPRWLGKWRTFQTFTLISNINRSVARSGLTVWRLWRWLSRTGVAVLHFRGLHNGRYNWHRLRNKTRLK